MLLGGVLIRFSAVSYRDEFTSKLAFLKSERDDFDRMLDAGEFINDAYVVTQIRFRHYGWPLEFLQETRYVDPDHHELFVSAQVFYEKPNVITDYDRKCWRYIQWWPLFLDLLIPIVILSIIGFALESRISRKVLT